MNITSYFTKHENKLNTLPYFKEEEKEQLLAFLNTNISKYNIEQLFKDKLQGRSPFARHIALDYLAATQREPSTHMEEQSLAVEKGTIKVYPGNLHVKGTIKNLGIIVVLGDITIEGNYVALPIAYGCLYIGGNLKVKNVYVCEAETIVLQTIKVEHAAILIGNHTITIADQLKVKVLITEDTGANATISAEAQEVNKGYQVFKKYYDLNVGAVEDMGEEKAEEMVYDALLSFLQE